MHSENRTGRGGKILIVDDEYGIRGLLSTAFQESGYDVVTASSCEEAIAAAIRWRSEIVLVITDVVMRGMSGAVLERLLSEELPSVPVILMSGYFGHAAFAHIQARQRLVFVQKPFDVEELLKQVTVILSAKR